jgi:hypothetical protein
VRPRARSSRRWRAPEADAKSARATMTRNIVKSSGDDERNLQSARLFKVGANDLATPVIDSSGITE